MRSLLVALMLTACASPVPGVPRAMPHDAGSGWDAWTAPHVGALPPTPHTGPTGQTTPDAGALRDASRVPCESEQTACECPVGSGDEASCPGGTVGTSFGCCPCTAADCDNPACCGQRVCAGAPVCATVRCHALPASCAGRVSFDCDDFPEDCDEPCCECTDC